MGTDISPIDVEESTEPPICGYTEEQHSQHIRSDNDVKNSGDPEKAKPLQNPATSESDSQSGSIGPPLQRDTESTSCYAHTLDPAQIATILQVDLRYVPFLRLHCDLMLMQHSHGLSGTESALRLARDGPNRVQEMEGVSVWKILLRQVSNSLTLV